MNVLFHTATAIATVVLVADSVRPAVSGGSYILGCLLSLIIGVIFHGILDYIPHCYPVNSRIDVMLSLLLMILLFWKTNRKYKPIVAASFIGNVLPDIIDLSPAILNKYFHLNIAVITKIFPWHQTLYSGSIYSDNCDVSNLNHLMIIAFVCIVCWLRKKQLEEIFFKNA
jgi:hypothetical protein